MYANNGWQGRKGKGDATDDRSGAEVSQFLSMHDERRNFTPRAKLHLQLYNHRHASGKPKILHWRSLSQQNDFLP